MLTNTLTAPHQPTPISAKLRGFGSERHLPKTHTDMKYTTNKQFLEDLARTRKRRYAARIRRKENKGIRMQKLLKSIVKQSSK